MPQPNEDLITIKTTVSRDSWAWVSAEAVRQGKEKRDIVEAAIQMYRESKEAGK
jgi:hypothetical protein